jgi:hypothetical protein
MGGLLQIQVDQPFRFHTRMGKQRVSLYTPNGHLLVHLQYLELPRHLLSQLPMEQHLHHNLFQ